MRYMLLVILLLVIHSAAGPVQPLQAQSTDGCPPTVPLPLAVGGQGRVVPGGTANRVRSTPSTSGEVVFQIAAGSVFDVIGEAECSDGYRWWQVRHQGQEGWTVEGTDEEYFLEILAPETDATSTAGPTAQPADCALEPRLVIGREGQVITDKPSRLRSTPSTDGAQVGQLQPRTVVSILDGPVCANGIQWWEVSVGELSGWTAEGLDGEYFLELVEIVPTPTRPTPTASVTPAATATSVGCEMEPLLAVGREGRLIVSTPSRVRATPSTDGAQVGQLQPQTIFSILSGPTCRDGINWWKVSVGELSGWTAEGLNGIYFLELVEIVPTATPAYIGLPNPGEVSWNSDGTRVAVGTDDGIFVYDASDWTKAPTQILAESRIISLAFAPNNPDLIAVSSQASGECGEDEGETVSGVFVYDLDADAVATMIRELSGCGGDHISQLQFSADGTILITNSSGQFVSYSLPDGEQALHIAPHNFSGFPAFDQIVISEDGSQVALAQTISGAEGNVGYLFRANYSDGELIGFEDGRITRVVTALAFSDDASQIIIGDEIGSLRTYTRPEDSESFSDYNSFIRGNRSTTSNRINAIAIGPEGEIVTAESDPHAIVRVFHPDSLQAITNYVAGQSTTAALDLDFNPDSSLLAVTIDDTVHILDTSDYSLVAELVLQRN